MASMANPTLGLPPRRKVVDMPPPVRDNVGQPPPGSTPRGGGGVAPPPGTAYRGGNMADPNSPEVLAAQERQRLRKQGELGGIKPATPGTATPTSLINQVNPDPKLNAQVDKTISSIDDRRNQLALDEKSTDPNQQFLIDQYKSRLTNDPTQRAVNRVASATRGQAALQQKQANAQAAMQGGNAGAHSAAIQSQAGRNLSKATADIALGRERDLDAMTLGGLGIMNAPNQSALIKSGNLNQFTLGGAATALNAAQAPSQLALQQGQLGVQQYSAQNNAQNANAQLALQQQQLQAQQAQQATQNYLQMLQMSGYPAATGKSAGYSGPGVDPNFRYQGSGGLFG